MLFKKPPFHPT